MNEVILATRSETLLVSKIYDALAEKRFKVGSGSYEVTVRRKIGDEP